MSNNFINLFTCPYIHNKMQHLITTATTCIHQMVLKSLVIINGEMGFIHMHIQSSKRVHTFLILKKKEKEFTPFPCLQI